MQVTACRATAQQQHTTAMAHTSSHQQNASAEERDRASFERRGGGVQKFLYQKWPDKIFPNVNFVFSREGHFGLGRGEEGFGGAPPPLVFNYSKAALDREDGYLIHSQGPWHKGIVSGQQHEAEQRSQQHRQARPPTSHPAWYNLDPASSSTQAMELDRRASIGNFLMATRVPDALMPRCTDP